MKRKPKLKEHRWVHCGPECEAPTCAWCVDCGEDQTNHEQPWLKKKLGPGRPPPYSVVQRRRPKAP
jgi:hypothetical protein